MSGFIVYRGQKFRITGTVRYYMSDAKHLPERLLHRYIWHCEIGPIEPGMHIHHKDENIFNNDISNFEKIPGKLHQSMHMAERMKNDEKNILNPMHNGANEAAKEWHASNAGRKWHSEHGKETWIDRKHYDAICHLCGSKYLTPFPTRSRFCSKQCIIKNANNNAKGKKRVRIKK